MLTNQELEIMKVDLRAARVLIDIVRGLHLGAGRTEKAMVLNDVAGVLGEEIEALDKEIAGKSRLRLVASA